MELTLNDLRIIEARLVADTSRVAYVGHKQMAEIRERWKPEQPAELKVGSMTLHRFGSGLVKEIDQDDYGPIVAPFSL